MFKRGLLFLLLFSLLLMGTASAADAPSPYAIYVNRAANTITIYTQDETGAYTVPYKAMVCSTARPGHTTPLGTFTLQAARAKWCYMLDGTYGQYATRFKGHFLFHSVCFKDDVHNAMILDAYNNLGAAASMGCVRLQTADAKWIYDNCPGGTSVTIYDDASNPGPLGKPAPLLDHISEAEYNGWDPTDPAEGNPWHIAVGLTIEPQTLTMTAGESAMLTASVTPRTASVHWNSSDGKVAAVHTDGTVIALSAGTAEITAYTQNGLTAVCTVQVEGELLPFDDLIPGAWYYPEIRPTIESGLFAGTGERTFEPEAPMSRAMVVQALYDLEHQPRVSRTVKSTFTDVTKDDPYYNAVLWAVSKGIVQGTSETEFCPDRTITRQELTVILWRYAEKPTIEADLSLFSDAGQVQDFAREALSWAVGSRMMNGNNGALQPHRQITRAETAVMFQRMLLQNSQ